MTAKCHKHSFSHSQRRRRRRMNRNHFGKGLYLQFINFSVRKKSTEISTPQAACRILEFFVVMLIRLASRLVGWLADWVNIFSKLLIEKIFQFELGNIFVSTFFRNSSYFASCLLQSNQCVTSREFLDYIIYAMAVFNQQPVFEATIFRYLYIAKRVVK